MRKRVYEQCVNALIAAYLAGQKDQSIEKVFGKLEKNDLALLICVYQCSGAMPERIKRIAAENRTPENHLWRLVSVVTKEIAIERNLI